MEEALSIGLAEGEVYTIGDKEIAPCSSCFRCATLKGCRIEDDFQELRDKCVTADAIIYIESVSLVGSTSGCWRATTLERCRMKSSGAWTLQRPAAAISSMVQGPLSMQHPRTYGL